MGEPVPNGLPSPSSFAALEETFLSANGLSSPKDPELPGLPNGLLWVPSENGLAGLIFSFFGMEFKLVLELDLDLGEMEWKSLLAGPSVFGR